MKGSGWGLIGMVGTVLILTACGGGLAADDPGSTLSPAPIVPSTPSTTSPVSTSTVVTSSTAGVDGFCEGIALTDELAYEASLPVDTIAVTVAIAGDGPLEDRAREALVEAADELEVIAAEIDSSYAGLGVSDPDLADEVGLLRRLVAAQFEFLASSVREAETGADVNAALSAAFGGGDLPEELASLVEVGAPALGVVNRVADERCGMIIDGR